jgi:hypothetical protein
LKLWGPDNGREVKLVPPCPPNPHGYDLGRFALAAAMWDRNVNRLYVWDIETGKLRFRKELPGQCILLRLSKGDKRLGLVLAMSRGGIELHLLNPKDGQALAPPVPLPQQMWSGLGTQHEIEFSPCGRRVAVWSGHSVYLVDAASGEQLTPLLPSEGPGGLESAFSPDGSLFLAKGRLYDAATGDPLTRKDALMWGRGGFRKDGAGVLVSVTKDGRLMAPGEEPLLNPETWNWAVHEPFVRAEGTPEELLARAELLAARKVNAAGALVNLTPEEVLQRWKATRR